MAILEFFHHRFEARSRLADEDDVAKDPAAQKQIEMGSSFTNPAKVQTESYRSIQLPSVRAPQEPRSTRGLPQSRGTPSSSRAPFSSPPSSSASTSGCRPRTTGSRSSSQSPSTSSSRALPSAR